MAGAITGLSSLSTTGLIASGPSALAILRLDSSFATQMTALSISGMEEHMYLPLKRSGIRLPNNDMQSHTALWQS